MFQDRQEAGWKLALRFESYHGHGVLALAIPKGEVEIGLEVALHLRADLSLLIARKLPLPGNPETGFGAIAEDGSTVIIPEAARTLSGDVIDGIIAAQMDEIRRRVRVLRNGKPVERMGGRTVILVDDGLAMGSTMRAAISMCRNQQAERIVVGEPVAGRRTAEQITTLADEVQVLEMPRLFRAVAEVYRHWHDVSDAEVVELLQRWDQEHIRTETAERERGSGVSPGNDATPFQVFLL